MTKEELEKEAIAKYKTGSYPQLHPDHWAFVHGYLAGAEPREKRIAELEKENAELKSECRTCVYTDSPCVPSDYEKDKNGTCGHFKNVFDRNAELKETVIKMNDVITKTFGNLAKAKEIIEGLMRFCRCFAQHHTEDIRYKEAEQFLKEIEK